MPQHQLLEMCTHMNHLPLDVLIDIYNRADNLKGTVCVNKETYTASRQTETYLSRKHFYNKTTDLFNDYLRMYIFTGSRPLCVLDLCDATGPTIFKKIQVDYRDSLHGSPIDYIKHVFHRNTTAKSNLRPYQLSFKQYANGDSFSLRENYLTLSYKGKSYYISMDESSTVTISHYAHYDDSNDTTPIFDKDSMYLIWGLMLVSKNLLGSKWVNHTKLVYSYKGSRKAVYEELLTLREEIDKASQYFRFTSVKLRYTLTMRWPVQSQVENELLALENRVEIIRIRMQILKSSGTTPIEIETS